MFQASVKLEWGEVEGWNGIEADGAIVYAPIPLLDGGFMVSITLVNK